MAVRVTDPSLQLYCAALAAIVVGAGLALFASTLAGAVLAGVGMFVAGVTDPGGEG